MKQVIVIGGGDSFTTHAEYIEDLKNREVTIDSFRSRKDWKALLSENLGTEFDVLYPRMPNSQNTRFAEWKIWFERMFPFLEKEVILIGHSLGAIFLVKYLSENQFPKKIKALLLVSPPSNHRIGVPDFMLPKSPDNVSAQCGQIAIYHSRDDAIVPFADMEDYLKRLPSARPRIFEDSGHFNQETFPEILQDLKTIT